MPYDPSIQKNEENKKNIFGVIVHSFFVIPFLLAIFSILLFVSVRILTMEKRNVNDYLEDVKTGGLTKRWQSAFELSRVLSNPKEVPHDDKFIKNMIAAFEKSKGDDDRIRQYLALAMGRSGIADFADILIKTAGDEKNENLYAIITGLGILHSDKAIPVLLDVLNSDNAHLRLAAVVALGNIGAKDSINLLKKSLNDPEPNVQWGSAISLANLKDPAGKEVLLKLLDRTYLARFPQVDLQEQTHVLLVALEAAGNLKDVQIKQAIDRLAKNDQNMNVRKLALKLSEK